MNNNKTKKRSSPELLAPAGSIEAFRAAIEAGADAVYLGFDAFNARLRAKNFSAQELCELVPYAHSRNVKVYVTLNTLIKQAEVKSVLHLLYQLEQLGVDAIIAADIGLMKLASVHFPGLRLHGSTQAAVHNVYGAAFLKTLGAKRVVLARELSLDEISETAQKSPIEIEVFIHGALCYSISGQCLASSYLGGASGNRGKCTQVCRRRFKCNGGKDGYFFSPYDLQAISVIDKLAKAGVASFKIEGRMRGAEYVRTTVQAYRRAIDSPDTAVSAARELCFDFGREKTLFFLNGRSGRPPIDPSRPSGTGQLIGTITECSEAAFTLSTKQNISAGDRLRVQPANGFEGAACKVVQCKMTDRQTEITITMPVQCNVGDHVFLIGVADVEAKKKAALTADGAVDENRPVANSVSAPAADDTAVIAPPITNLKTVYPNAAKIAGSLTPENAAAKTSAKPKLWFKADTVEWLDILNATPCQHLIFDAGIDALKQLHGSPGVIKTWRSRMFIALPPFIEEGQTKLWRGLVEDCLNAGLSSFTIENISHFALTRGAAQLATGPMLFCMNRFTQKEFAARGVSYFVFSYEDEYLNIRDAAPRTKIAGIAPVYGRPPLFISRMQPAIDCNTPVTDPQDNTFFVSEKNGLYYTLPQKPMCLFAKREKLLACGIENFLIDLCFHNNPSYEFVNKLVTGFKDGVRIRESTIFNFKAGLH